MISDVGDVSSLMHNGPEPDTTHFDHINKVELGDNPFVQPGNAPVGVDTNSSSMMPYWHLIFS